MSNLILPGDPEFDCVLANAPPPNWRSFAWDNSGECVFVADSSTGILRPANWSDTDDYVLGGEYEERLASIDEDDAEPDLDLCLIPLMPLEPGIY